MKKHSVKFLAILFVSALFLTACTLKAQSVGVSPAQGISSPQRAANAKIDATGNYTAVTKQAPEPTATGKTFTDAKGTVYPVFKSEAGKLFYFRTSANTGKEYKVYITL